MTTLDTMPTMREFALMKIASLSQKRASRTRESEKAFRVNAVLNALVRVVLHLAGFGLLTMAGFQFNIIAGLIVAGISCFALSKLMAPESGGADEAVSRAPDLRTGR